MENLGRIWLLGSGKTETFSEAGTWEATRNLSPNPEETQMGDGFLQPISQLCLRGLVCGYGGEAGAE